jgi:hypothetical protein
VAQDEQLSTSYVVRIMLRVNAAGAGVRPPNIRLIDGRKLVIEKLLRYFCSMRFCGVCVQDGGTAGLQRAADLLGDTAALLLECVYIFSVTCHGLYVVGLVSTRMHSPEEWLLCFLAGIYHETWNSICRVTKPCNPICRRGITVEKESGRR